jgi:hypothetical protein
VQKRKVQKGVDFSSTEGVTEISEMVCPVILFVPFVVPNPVLSRVLVSMLTPTKIRLPQSPIKNPHLVNQ